MNAIRMPQTVRYPLWLALCLLFLAAELSSAADDQAYVIEMVVFERPGGGAEEFWPDAPDEPDRALADRMLGAGTAIPAEARALGPIAYTLSRRGLVVHRHLAWQEVPAPRNSQAWQWLDAGRLSGLVKVTRGRFLHLDTDLLLRDAGSPATYRVQLSRRMRSNELHYIDHPRVGIVIQATRVERPAVADNPDPAAGEPLPASPPDAEPPAD
jgi:hypothetical protein